MKTIHEGQKDHKCDFCDKSYSTAWHMKSHIKNSHNGLKDQNCDICSKSFSTKTGLNAHVKIVHGQRQFLWYIFNKKIRIRWHSVLLTIIYIEICMAEKSPYLPQSQIYCMICMIISPLRIWIFSRFHFKFTLHNDMR